MKEKTLKIIFVLILSIVIFTTNGYAASNPYGKYQTLYGIKTIRCTWYAWQQAYEHTGVALPGWGNAQEWYNEAINSGYKVGGEAKPNSIAVWSSSDGYGHVGFVVSVDGNLMTVNEAGIVTEENEGVVNGSHKYTTAGNLIGFIYLDEAPTSNNGTSNNTNSNKNNTSKEELSSNANLSDLEMNMEGFSFDKEITEYSLEVDYETRIIHISATAEDEKAIVTGTGDKALKVGENTYTITVTAENNNKKEYKITIVRKDKIIEQEKKLEESTNSTDLKEPKKKNLYFYIGIGLIFVIVITIIIILIIKNKRKKKTK